MYRELTRLARQHMHGSLQPGFSWPRKVYAQAPRLEPYLSYFPLRATPAARKGPVADRLSYTGQKSAIYRPKLSGRMASGGPPAKLLVDTNKDLFYCYGCGRGGDVIRFAEIYHQMKFPQALAWLRQWRGVEPLLHKAESCPRPRWTASAQCRSASGSPRSARPHRLPAQSARGGRWMSNNCWRWSPSATAGRAAFPPGPPRLCHRGCSCGRPVSASASGS